MRTRLILLLLLLETFGRGLLVADQFEDFNDELKNANCVIIAMPTASHGDAHAKLLLYYGSAPPAFASEKVPRITQSLFALMDPDNPILYIESNGKTSFQSLAGVELQLRKEDHTFAKIPFAQFTDYIESIRNPILIPSFVADNWFKFVPPEKEPEPPEKILERLDKALKIINDRTSPAQ